MRQANAERDRLAGRGVPVRGVGSSGEGGRHLVRRAAARRAQDAFEERGDHAGVELGTGAPGWQQVRFTFIAGGNTSRFQVNDFWVDPHICA